MNIENKPLSQDPQEGQQRPEWMENLRANTTLEPGQLEKLDQMQAEKSGSLLEPVSVAEKPAEKSKPSKIKEKKDAAVEFLEDFKGANKKNITEDQQKRVDEALSSLEKKDTGSGSELIEKIIKARTQELVLPEGVLELAEADARINSYINAVLGGKRALGEQELATFKEYLEAAKKKDGKSGADKALKKIENFEKAKAKETILDAEPDQSVTDTSIGKADAGEATAIEKQPYFPSESEIALAPSVPAEVLAQVDTMEKETFREKALKEAEAVYDRSVGGPDQYVRDRLDNVYIQKRQQKINETFSSDKMPDRQRQKYNDLMRGVEESVLNAKQIEGLFAAGKSLDQILNIKRAHWWSDKYKSELFPGKVMHIDEIDKEIEKIIQANEEKIKKEAKDELESQWKEKHDYYLAQIPKQVDRFIEEKEAKLAQKAVRQAELEKKKAAESISDPEKLLLLAELQENLQNAKKEDKKIKEIEAALAAGKLKCTTKDGKKLEGDEAKQEMEKFIEELKIKKGQFSNKVMELGERLSGKKLRNEVAKDVGYDPKAEPRDAEKQRLYRIAITQEINDLIEKQKDQLKDFSKVMDKWAAGTVRKNPKEKTKKFPDIGGLPEEEKPGIKKGKKLSSIKKRS